MLTSIGCVVWREGGVRTSDVSFLQICMSISNRNKLYNIFYSNNQNLIIMTLIE